MSVLNRSNALVAAATIRDETVTDANSATRVGTLHTDTIDTTFPLSTFASLRSTPGQANAIVRVSSYSSPGDGGGGEFYYRTSGGPYVDDSGTIAVPSGGDGSEAWVRQYPGTVVNLAWFGMSSSSASTNLAAWNRAIVAIQRMGGGTILIPGGTWPIASTLSIPTDDITVAGEGAGRTIIDWANTASCFDSTGTRSNITIRDITIIGEWDSYQDDEPAVIPVDIRDTENVRAYGLEIKNCTFFAIVMRNCVGVSISKCHLSEIGRDGISLQGCSGIVVTHNRIEHIDDDAITVHTEEPLYTGTYRQGVVIANNYIADAQGITALGLRRASITGNVIERCRLRGIYIGTAEASEISGIGSSSSFSVAITGNTILDIYDRNTIDALSSNAFYIMVDGLPAAGTGVAVPGRPDATGTFEPIYDALDNIVVGSPTPPPTWLTISGNMIAVTRPIGVSYSTYGHGNMFTRTGYINPTITAAIARNTQYGVVFGGGARHCIVSNNIFNGMDSCVRFTGATSDHENITIAWNIATEFSYGVVATASPTGGRNINIVGNIFDSDPYHAHTNRGSAGTWSVQGSPTAIYQQNLSGVAVWGNTFKNVNTISDKWSSSGSDDVIARNNFIECDPSAIGHSTSNGGIGNIPRSGEGFIVKVVECDPANSSYGDTLNLCQVDSVTVPSSGKYVVGHFVRNISSTGNPFGWLRLTTGSTHVMWTDWRPIGGSSVDVLEFGDDPPDTGAIRLSDGEAVAVKFADASSSHLVRSSGNVQLFGTGGKERNDYASAFNVYIGGNNRLRITDTTHQPVAANQMQSGGSTVPWTDVFSDRYRPTEYTVSSLPSPVTYGYSIVLVTDGAEGSPCLAFAVGAQWLRISVGAAVASS